MKIYCKTKGRYRARSTEQLRDDAYFTSLNILVLIDSYLETYAASPSTYDQKERADAMLFMVQREAATLRDLLRELDRVSQNEATHKIAG